MRIFILCILSEHMVCFLNAVILLQAHSFGLCRHGPISDCKMSSSESFVMQYIQALEGSTEREQLERRYGKANLRRLVAKYEEDVANKKWLDQSTMACPSCRVKVEKSMGCNHVSLLPVRHVVLTHDLTLDSR